MEFEQKPRQQIAQEYVNRFSQEIRHKMKILLEPITVEEETRFKRAFYYGKQKPIAMTYYGTILINPNHVFNSEYESLEVTMLHELGHRIHKTLSPAFEYYFIPESFSGLLKDLFNGSYIVEKSLQEGVAEVFALDILPDFCKISQDTKRIINKRREIRKRGIKIEDKRIARRYDRFPGTYISAHFGLTEKIKTDGNEKEIFFIDPITTRGYRYINQIYSKKGLDDFLLYLKSFSKKDIPTRRELINLTV